MGMINNTVRKKRISRTYQTNTSNMSFIKMYNVLKELGVRNNHFHLVLYDATLQNVNPRDPNLSMEMKARVMAEVKKNFWYFIREVLRIPVPGNSEGVKYALHRGNMAMNWALVNNLKSILELPRQNFKTISAAAFYAWLWEFGTTNSEVMFMNRKQDDANLNLERVRKLIDTLPEYLRTDRVYSKDGKKLQSTGNKKSADHPLNENKIVTGPRANSPEKARDIGRGCTQPHQWYDEKWFTPYNKEIFMAATPANSEASLSAKKNGKPHGILITSTPGVLSTSEGLYGKEVVDGSLRFHDKMYDWSRDKVLKAMDKSANTKFLYIKYSYKQLGRSEEWFRDVCADLNYDWAVIRREYLLEWAKSSDLSPFHENDLNTIESLTNDPIDTIWLAKYFKMDLYKDIYAETAPIMIGVDISGGYSRDSTAIVLVSSETTEVLGVMNSNRISGPDLTKVLKDLVITHIPNSVIMPERNTYGDTVIRLLLDSTIRNTIYYEKREQVLKETRKNGRIYKSPSDKYEYGIWTDKKSRKIMMELLRDYVNNHKHLFVSPIISDEIAGLEYRKGRIDHGSSSHDDTVMAYLMTLYAYHYGNNLDMFGIERRDLSDDGLFVEAQKRFDYKKRGVNDVYENIKDLVGFEKEKSMLNLTSNTKHLADFYRENEREVFRQQTDLNKKMDGDDARRLVDISNEFFDSLNGFGSESPDYKDEDDFDNFLPF